MKFLSAERHRFILITTDGKQPGSFLQSTNVMKRDHRIISRADRLFWPTLFLVAAVRLWLLDAVDLWIIGSAGHDDLLFMRQASSILSGTWFGDYDRLTLIKAPLFPVFAAANHTTGIPLLLSQQILVLAGGMLIAAVLRRCGYSPLLLICTFVLFAFNPAALANHSLRAVRDPLYGALVVWMVAAVALLLATFHTRRAYQVGAAALLGFVCGLIWLTREEGIWILAPLGCAALLFVVFPDRRHRQAFSSRAVQLGRASLVAVLVFAAVVQAFREVHQSYYGEEIVSEQQSDFFHAAYGALNRIKHPAWRPYIPVPLAVRTEAYRASPAFNELKPHLEGPYIRRWIRNGCRYITPCDDYASHFVWAFRDAVSAAGYHRSLPRAKRFYLKIAQEINAACESGKLSCNTQRSSMLPVLRKELFVPWIRSLGKSVVHLATFRDTAPGSDPSLGAAEQLFLFERITNHRVRKADEQHSMTLNPIRWMLLGGLSRAYALVMPVICLLALAGWLRGAVRTLCSGKGDVLFTVLTMILVALVARAALLALVDVTAFEGVMTLYLTPSFVLLPLFCGLGVGMLILVPREVDRKGGADF